MRISSLRIPYDVHLTITRQPNLRSEAGKPTLRLLCQILGFPPASVVTDAGLKAAKRRLSIATHPDKATDLACFGALPSQLAVASQRVNIAYELLSGITLPIVSPQPHQLTRPEAGHGGSGGGGGSSSSSSSGGSSFWPSWARSPKWDFRQQSQQSEQPPPQPAPPPQPTRQQAQQQSWWARWFTSTSASRAQQQAQAQELKRKADEAARQATAAQEAAAAKAAAAAAAAKEKAQAQVRSQRERAAAAARGGASGKRPASASSSSAAAEPPPKAARTRSASVSEPWADFCALNKQQVMQDGFRGNDIFAELGRRWRQEKERRKSLPTAGAN